MRLTVITRGAEGNHAGDYRQSLASSWVEQTAVGRIFYSGLDRA